MMITTTNFVTSTASVLPQETEAQDHAGDAFAALLHTLCFVPPATSQAPQTPIPEPAEILLGETNVEVTQPVFAPEQVTSPLTTPSSPPVTTVSENIPATSFVAVEIVNPDPNSPDVSDDKFIAHIDQLVTQGKIRPESRIGKPLFSAEMAPEVIVAVAIHEGELTPVQSAPSNDTNLAFFGTADAETSTFTLKDAIKPLLEAAFDSSRTFDKTKNEQVVDHEIDSSAKIFGDSFVFVGTLRESETSGNAKSISFQVSHEFLRLAESMPAPGKRSIRIRLNPEELGEVNLEVTRDAQGRVSAHLSAEREATSASLSQSLDQLRRSLEREGLTVEKLEVTTQTSQFANDEQAEPQAPRAQYGSRSHRTSTVVETETPGTPLDAARLLSLRA